MRKLEEFIREQYPEYISDNGEFLHPLTFDIGFINPQIEIFQGDDIANDETEFSASNVHELEQLYADFCKENELPADTVTYVELAVNESFPKPYVAFSKDEKILCSYSVEGTFPGELMSTRRLLAADCNCNIEDIKVFLVNGGVK